ncbi:MAG: insulinase family protein [Eubacterium sp.]|nr:insulinase family protein [Eubacterium sp.]
MKINDCVHGFILKREEEIQEVHGIARVFEHEKTGARLVYISNDDNNKVFHIGFRTPSDNSTGVAHILEHSVLCGSRKYPVKEPFVELAKGSLNTFLNAMTYPDKTVYPIASTNAKDFMNLMDVYLDAVFYPDIYKVPYIFYQEGWHYHLEKKEDPITYNGVVYNEMKGVFSSPEEILHHNIFETLYPDSIYGKESGGDPDVIPDLSYEDFVNFHKKFYHPSNAYIYFYGDGDVEAHLAYLNDNYLSQFDRAEIDSSIATQKPFTGLREAAYNYPVAGDEDFGNRDYLSLSYVLENEPTFEDIMAFEILGHILLGSNASPLKKALLDLDICKEVDYSYSSAMKQPYFSIILKHTDIKHKDLFLKTVKETLEGLVRDGLDAKSVEAGISINEFSLVEGEYGAYPKGLMYGLEMFDTWLYGGDPLSHLKYKDVIEKLRASSKNRGFEALIARYLLFNDHKAMVSIHPDPQLAERKERALTKKLADYKASLSEAELEALVEETQLLLERQNTEDTPEALESIPMLSLSEIDKKARIAEMSVETYRDNTLLYHPGHTGGIAYLKLFFDTRVLPREDLKYLSLLNKIIGRISTEDYDYQRLNQEIEIHTGGISSSVETYDNVKMPGSYESKFIIRGKAMADKAEDLVALMTSVILKTRFDEKNLIHDIISEVRMNKENQFLMGGHTVSVQRLQSYYSQSARMFEELGGVEFYRFIADLDDNFDARWEALSEKLQAVAAAIFNRKYLVVSITGEEAAKASVLAALDKLYDKLLDEATPFYDYLFELEPKNEGFMTAAKIQYVSKGYNIRQLGYDYSGSLLVLKSILAMDYLWNRVRVQGGAYGAFFGINRSGDMYMASYRDPNLQKTIDAYNDACSYIEGMEVSNRELEKYIIGTISSKDVPLSAALMADAADTMYFNRTTAEDVQRERDEILGTTLDTLRSTAQMVREVMGKELLCVIGSEEAVREAQDCFGEIRYIK